MPQLTITERRYGGVTVLSLDGRLVLEEGDAPLRDRIDALVNDGRIDIVLNMHDVNYIDSCGVGAIVSKFVSLKRRGGQLKLVCPSMRCQHVLEITHLMPVFQVFESDEAAVASFGAVAH
jgi:anti-sigma B factor antagonist